METPIEEGNLFWLIALGCMAMCLLGFSLILFYFLHRKKITNKEINLQRMALQHQENLLQHNVTVQEEERKRIARDLHDEIGSRLNLSRLHIATLKSETEQPNKLIDTSLNILDSVIESSRKISHMLLPPVLEEFGLNYALNELMSEIDMSSNLQTSYIFVGELPTKRGDEIELGLFRIAQEFINNTLKHAQATSLSVSLEASSETITLCLADNGVGLPDAVNRQGMGLKNIENRAKMIQATAQWRSTQPKGTTLELTLKNL